MRNRAGVILWCKSKNQILFIKRIKDNKTYWVVPGGGLKDGESYEAAAKRELHEELGLCVENITELVTLNLTRGIEKYYYAIVHDVFDAIIQGEEADRQSSLNQYIPKWILIDELYSLNLMPPELREHILKVVQ